MSARRSSSQQSRGGSRPGLYRHGRSNASQASFMEEVDMASEDIFSGPVSESVPSSNVGFFHRRESVAESEPEFTYYDEEEHAGSDESYLEEEGLDEEAVEVVADYEQEMDGTLAHDNQDARSHDTFAEEDTDVEAQLPRQRPSSKRRKSSGYSRSSRASRESARDPLLKRSNSQGSNASNTSGRGTRDRVSQKIHIQSEDLTIVIAGFRTSLLGLAIYITICILTAGLGYLVFRWLPRWRVKVIGSPSPLSQCTWVVVEVCH